MQAAKKGAGHELPPQDSNRRSNADHKEKRRKIEPVEGSQTGSEGLGYLTQPAGAEEDDKGKDDRG